MITPSNRIAEQFEVTVQFLVSEPELLQIANSELSVARMLLKYHFGEKAPLKLLLDIRNYLNNRK